MKKKGGLFFLPKVSHFILVIFFPTKTTFLQSLDGILVYVMILTITVQIPMNVFF
jgi:hypothetical protein